MAKTLTTAQVYRFHDCVAAYLGGGQTVYLTPKDARKLARALVEFSKDCECTICSTSILATRTLHLSDTGHNGTAYTIERGEK